MRKKVQKENNTINNGDIIVSNQSKFFKLIDIREVGIVVNQSVIVFKNNKAKIYNISKFLEKGVNEVYTPKKYYSKSEQQLLANNYVNKIFTNLNDFINSVRPNTIGENEPIEANKYYKPVIMV